MRILIIRLSALGDVITASPTARVIKADDPNHEVVWAVEQRCADAVIGSPFVDEVIVLPSSSNWKRLAKTGHWGELNRLRQEVVQQLRARPFEVVLELQGLFKSALLAGVARGTRKLMPADAAERLPFLFTDLVPRHELPWHTSTMYTSLLEPLGIKPRSAADLKLVMPIGDEARERMAAWRARHGLTAGEYVAITPGTTRPQKMWPDEYWPDLLERLARRLGLPAVILGGPSELALAAGIVARTRTPVYSAVGQTNLKETGALLESARVTVGVDTGPMHMAVAVGCPTISLFGSTGPRWFLDGSLYLCLHREFACWPCHRHPICRHYECLRAIRPQDVEREVVKLLTAGGLPEGG